MPYASNAFEANISGGILSKASLIFIVAFEPEQIGVLLPADIELREPIHP